MEPSSPEKQSVATPSLYVDVAPLAHDILVDHSQELTGREQSLEKYLRPYHIHFIEGVEGEVLNPEGAEYNFDTLLMLTQVMHERSSGTGGDIKQITSWFFDKHSNTDISPEMLRKPSNIVRLWLTKLGPHNDLAEAEDDLELARSWLLNLSKRPDRAVQGTNGELGKELGLIADLDIELADAIEDERHETYLEEAIPLLERSRDVHLEENRWGYAALDQTTLASVRLEIARHKLLKTRLLTDDYTDEDYAKLDEAAENELAELDNLIVSGLNHSLELIDDDSATEEDLIKIRNDMAMFFEVITYYSLLEALADEQALATAKVRPATIRQEKGTTHKIFSTAQEKGEKKEDFNFNFDLEFSFLNPDRNQPGEGLFKSIYIQNKLNPGDAKHMEADEYSHKFFKGKEFRFLTPESLINLDTTTLSGSHREKLKVFGISMRDFITDPGSRKPAVALES